MKTTKERRTSLMHALSNRVAKALGLNTQLTFISHAKDENTVYVHNASTQKQVCRITQRRNSVLVHSALFGDQQFGSLEAAAPFIRNLTHFPKRPNNRRGYGKCEYKKQYAYLAEGV